MPDRRNTFLLAHAEIKISGSQNTATDSASMWVGNYGQNKIQMHSSRKNGTF